MLSTEYSLQDAAVAWKQAIDAKDPDRIATFFAQDTVAMYPRPSPTNGREANRQAWAAVYSDPDAEHPITVERVEMSRSGELGYVYGKWWSHQPAREYDRGGRYMAVWKLVGSQWQIVMLSANVHDDVREEHVSP